MTKEIYISTTPHETRLAIVEDEQLVEVHYERENEYTLAGAIYNGRVTRVLPGMQSAFVDVGLDRDAFLYVTDFIEEQEDTGEFDRTSLPGQAASRFVRGEQNGEQGAEGRSDRGGDRGGDRGRDRGSDRGRGRGRDRGGERSAAPERSQDDLDEVDSLSTGSLAPDNTRSLDDASVEPGARRWRGRRGRRRGRGGRTPGEGNGERTPGAGGERIPSAAAPNVPTGETIQLHSDDDSWGDEPLAPFSSQSPAPLPVPEPRRSSGDRPRREASAGGDRPRRDRDAEPRADKPRRDFEPRSSESSSGRSRGSAEPAFVLPGESLSKYGGGGRESQSGGARPSATASGSGSSRPSTLIDVPLTWDGGTTLPGESISRHRKTSGGGRAESAPQTSSQPQWESKWEGSHEVLEHHDFAASSVAAPLAETAAAPEEKHSEHASASYSVDPVAPSEFRMPTPEMETAETEEFVAEEFVPEEVIAQDLINDELVTGSHGSDEVGFGEIEVEEFDETETETLERQQAGLHDPHTGHSEEDSARRELAHQFGHEMASRGGHGDEIFPAVPNLLDDDELEESDSVDAHSHVHEAGHTHEGGHAAGDAQHSASRAEALGFAPGSGEVDEEIIEDEEYDFEPLHAHPDDLGEDEQMEELSEQQMEAGDVGEFVRDKFVDEQTGAVEGEAEAEDSDDAEVGEIDDIGDYEEPEFNEDGEEIVREGSGAGASRERSSPTDAVSTDGRQRRGRRGRRMPGGRGAPRRSSMGGGGGGGRRQSAQSTSLPIITDLLKPGQEILVQIAKEPIAKKGARITSHIALPGRFLVYMPTVNHVGVSRKIASDEERQRLKRILLSEKGDANGGFIVRTAAGSASEQELRADIRFLINLWTEIKQRSEQAKSPALIYHDLNLVERVLRDQVTDRFSVIWVDTEEEYERVVRFLTRFQPALVRHVKLYTKETPLFEQFGIQEEINKALKSKVWLKSGGSIVINQTEALVAIDINTGKYVGKTARLEDTILKTNLDAIPEIVRQVRLRDLGGIIVIDFIDMDERRSRQRVMQALEEALKADRAPSKVLQFNDFGLVAITRKRVKQSLERTLSMPCAVCTGTGMVKNPVTVCNEIYVELRKMHRHFDQGDILLRVNPEVVKQLKSNNSRWLQDMEEMAGKTIIVKSDPSLNSEQFDIH